MAVVDPFIKAHNTFLNQSAEVKKKIDSAAAKIQIYTALGALGFFFVGGLILASIFSMVFGLSELTGRLISDSSWGHPLGHIAFGCLIIGMTVLILVRWKKSLLKS